MFDIGFPELLLVSVVVLLVFGPERLPEVLRSVGRFVGGARRSFASLRAELEREVGADEIRRELHNASIMDEVNRIGDSVRAGRDEVEELLGKRYAALEAEGRVAGSGAADANAEAVADSSEPEAAAKAAAKADASADEAATEPEPTEEARIEPASSSTPGPAPETVPGADGDVDPDGEDPRAGDART